MDPRINPAPSLPDLMKELGIRDKPGWTARLPSGLAAILSNKKGLAGVVILTAILLLGLFAPVLAPFDPLRRAGLPNVHPNWDHLLGTTRLGKDVFSQMLYGARTSLTVGFVAGSAATIVGLIVGISSGYFGGKIDEILTFFVNVVLVLPALPLIIVFAAFVDKASPMVIGVVLAATGWGWSARTIRTQTLSLRQRDFVLAAELLGERKWRIIMMEIFPNMVSFVVGGFVLGTIYAIIAETGLEFIDLGNPASVTWGTMLFWAQKNAALVTGAWWEVWPPCVAIMVTAAALVLINFSVDELTSPQLRAARNAGRIRRYLSKRKRSVDVF